MNQQSESPQVYHITWVTHNSRVSERMVEFRVERGEPLILSAEEEIEITGYILDIIKKDNLKILSYNICRDHVHLILVCAVSQRDKIVRKLKGKTAQLYKKTRELGDKFHLWAQKYSWTATRDEEQLNNTIEYIRMNRRKHKLPESKELQLLIDKMITPWNDIFFA